MIKISSFNTVGEVLPDKDYLIGVRLNAGVYTDWKYPVSMLSFGGQGGSRQLTGANNGELKENNYNVSTNNPVYNLDMKWNCWNNNSKIVQEPFIKTWHGMQYADKLTAISSHLNLKK